MPRAPRRRARATTLAVVVAAVTPAAAHAATPSGLITLRPAAPASSGWTALVERPEDRVTPIARGRALRIADRRGRPGYAMVGTRFAERSAVGVRARVRVVRLRLRPGRLRAVVEVGGTSGTALRAGLAGTGRGLRWAVWRTERDGTVRDLRVSRARVRIGAWHSVTVSTRWARSLGGATLRVDGGVAARTRPADLTGRAAGRVNVGLGRPSSARETGVVLLRDVVTWGSPVRAAAVAAAAAPAPPPPPPPALDALPGREIARMDFESGSTAGSSSFQAVARDRIQVIGSPALEGRYAARFEVRNGDNPIGYGDRAELSVATNEREGQERWYTWATMFDRSYPMGGGWQVVTQWHSTQSGSPPVGFYAENGRYRLQVWPRNSDGSSAGPQTTIWETPIQTGVWYRIRLHVKWSGSDGTGFVELFVNGQPAGRRTQIRTMYPGYGNYFKMGYYRQSGIAQTGVVYHDGFRATEVP